MIQKIGIVGLERWVLCMRNCSRMLWGKDMCM